MIVLLELLVLAGIVVAVALVSAGRTDGMSDVPPDARDLGLPDDGPLAVQDLERVRFPLAFRGYQMADVDRVLDRLAGELTRRDEQLRELLPEAPDPTTADDEEVADSPPAVPARVGPRRVLRRPSRPPEAAADDVEE